MVPARITVVTLGARDHAALRKFYLGLGWELAVDLDDFCCFEMRGAVLCLFPYDSLAADGNVDPASVAEGMRGFSIAINVDERDEVDAVIEGVREAGGRVTKEPETAEWGGRSAYFADPEENYWEVAWLPPDSKVNAAIRRATG